MQCQLSVNFAWFQTLIETELMLSSLIQKTSRGPRVQSGLMSRSGGVPPSYVTCIARNFSGSLFTGISKMRLRLMLPIGK